MSTLGIIALIRNDTAFQQLYNCTFYDYRSIPLAQRRNIPVGVALATLGIVQWVYLNNVYVILREIKKLDHIGALCAVHGCFLAST
jgi:hypothetical protein